MTLDHFQVYIYKYKTCLEISDHFFLYQNAPIYKLLEKSQIPQLSKPFLY